LGKQCYFGPCGAHIDNVWQGSHAEVFHPTLQPQFCGYQVTTGSHHVVTFPEEYTGQQPYEGVIASCSFTVCRGTPAVVLSVDVVGAAATGRVDIDPQGVTLLGDARASLAFDETVTPTAEPQGRHARVVFSGDCIKTGEYGEKAECTLKLMADPKVVVTYNCQKGFTCERGNKN
jgi:hypothetical protein